MKMTKCFAALMAVIAVFAVTVVVSAKATTAQQKPASSGLRAEIEALHAEMTAALGKDSASVARFYTDDARVLGGGQRFTGTAQVRTYFGQIPAGVTWTLEIIDLGGSPAEPWVLGRSTLGRAGSPGQVVDYLSILKRGADGKLRYHIDMYTMGVR
jgi:ketosteroid isomerase-like protein